jgi:hypothetical protein
VSVAVGELLVRRVVGVDSDCVVFDRAGLGGWDLPLTESLVCRGVSEDSS